MILLNILTNNLKNIVLHVKYKSKNNTLVLVLILVFDLQLHNVTLALDLLDNTGLQVSGVDPQGEDVTGRSANTHSALLTTDLYRNRRE